MIRILCQQSDWRDLNEGKPFPIDSPKSYPCIVTVENGVIDFLTLADCVRSLRAITQGIAEGRAQGWPDPRLPRPGEKKENLY